MNYSNQIGRNGDGVIATRDPAAIQGLAKLRRMAAGADTQQKYEVIQEVLCEGKFSLLETHEMHQERLRQDPHDNSIPRESWALTNKNRVVSEVLLDLVSKLRKNPNLHPKDLSLAELCKALEDATEVAIEYWEEEICDLLGRAFSTRQFPNVQKLLLREERQCWTVLESIASGNLPNLNTLCLLYLPLGSKELALIVQALDAGHLSKLTSLELRDNGIGDETLEALGRAATRGDFRKLEILRLKQESFWSGDDAEAEEPGESEADVVDVGLEVGGLGDEPISLEISNSGRLLQYSVIGDNGAKAFAEGLMSGKMQSLNCLELCISSESLGAEGISAIAGVFEEGCIPAGLKTLRLANDTTSILQEGTDAVAKALASEHMSPHLEELCLGRFEGGEIVTAALASRQFPVLKSLSLCDMKLGVQAAGSIAKALELDRLPALRVLDLRDNDLGEEGVKAIANAFKSGRVTNLEELHFSLKGPGDGDVIAIAEVLSGSHLPNLKAMELQHNMLGDRGAEALLNAYLDNPSCIVDLETTWPIDRPWYRDWSDISNKNWMEECKRPVIDNERTLQ